MPQPRAALVLVALTATVLASSQERAVPASGTSLLAKVGLSGAIACSFSHTLVTPLDVIKTQMQVKDVDVMQLAQQLPSASACLPCGMISLCHLTLCHPLRTHCQEWSEWSEWSE